jgi:diaminohydroxyphosphoribosylaminopyrimidine deaminase/5-amino-6-(5-phosphoribosylamino)uracil reductase
MIDELHVFVAPKLLGGHTARTPIAGAGLAEVSGLPALEEPQVEVLDGDVYIHGDARK